MLLVFVFCAEALAQTYIREGHQTLVADGAIVETRETGFGFLEGPIADRYGNIYFTDIPENRIYIWTIENKLITFRENSGGANGLAFLNENTLVVCEGANRQLTEITLDGKVTVLADRYEGKKLNSPNDLWIDPKGGIYFTDPRYGDRHDLELDGEYVYYLSPDRQKLSKVVDDLVRPNGVLGSPDGKLLYVADRSGDANFVYTINEDGTLSNKTFFSSEGSDGLTMDSEGNIYITSPKGEPPFHVSIYSPEGVKLEEIVTPEKPGNVHFGGKDGKTLFIPARTSLYAINMRVGGMAQQHIQPPLEAEEYTSADGLLTVRKVNTVRMNDVDPMDHRSNNEAAEFSPDGSLLAVACGDMTVRVITVPEGKIVKEFPLYDVSNPPVNHGRKAYEVEVVYWTPDSKYIVAAGNQVLPAMVVEYATGNIVQVLVQGEDQDALTISNNGKYMAVAANDVLVVYQTSDWSEIKRFKPTDDGDMNSFEFSPDDKYLITGGNDGHVGLISVPDFKLVKDLHEGGGYIKAARFSPDGKYIARSSHHAYFQVWSIDGEMLKQVSQPDYVEGLAFHPNGKLLVAGGKDMHYRPAVYPIKIYSFPDLEHLLDVPIGGENVEYLDISPNGRYMAQPSTTGNVILWEIVDSANKIQLPSKSSWEAEQFMVKRGRVRPNDHASEGQYVDMSEFGYIICDFEAAAGVYNLTFSIRTPDKDDPRHMGLFVNGEKIDVLKTVSTDWEPYVVENVTLAGGSKLIEIRDSEGIVHGDELDIDKIDIEFVSEKTAKEIR